MGLAKNMGIIILFSYFRSLFFSDHILSCHSFLIFTALFWVLVIQLCLSCVSGPIPCSFVNVMSFFPGLPAVSSWLFFSSHEYPVHCSLDKANFTLLFCHVRPLKSALSRMFWHGFLKFQLCRLSCFRSIFTAVPTHLTWYCENLYLLFLLDKYSIKSISER